MLVIGFGGGGGAAAIEAFDSGAEVLVIDAAEQPGGATSVNGGVIQAAGTSVQKAAGFTDSPEAWLECLKAEIGPGYNDDHLKAMTQGSPDMIEWLLGLGAVIPAELHDSDTRSIPESGLYFSDASLEFFPDADPTPRGHVVDQHGPGFLAALQGGIDSRGIELLASTAGIALYRDATGRVVGAQAEQNGSTLSIKARKAVVVATGHFSLNEDMVKKHIPQILAMEGARASMNPNARTNGDGHRMMSAVGADLANMTSGTFYGSAGCGSKTEMYTVFVNKYAQRFFCEQGYHGNYRGTALMQQPEQIGFAIYDDAILAKAGDTKPENILFSANSIEELAGLIGLNPDALAMTIARYNSNCERGNDPDFNKRPAFLEPIKNPPFHAGVMSYSWMTAGGAVIDTSGRVLDMDGNAISGLYAAGMCTVGVYGKLNPGSGVNMAWNFYTGRLAGKNAAAETA